MKSLVLYFVLSIAFVSKIVNATKAINPINSRVDQKKIISFAFTYQILECKIADSAELILIGTIFDRETKEGIPFVTVFDTNKKYITRCDSEGHFELKISKQSLKHTLILNFSVVGYKQIHLRIKKKNLSRPITIFLDKVLTQL